MTNNEFYCKSIMYWVRYVELRDTHGYFTTHEVVSETPSHLVIEDFSTGFSIEELLLTRKTTLDLSIVKALPYFDKRKKYRIISRSSVIVYRRPIWVSFSELLTKLENIL